MCLKIKQVYQRETAQEPITVFINNYIKRYINAKSFSTNVAISTKKKNITFDKNLNNCIKSANKIRC